MLSVVLLLACSISVRAVVVARNLLDDPVTFAATTYDFVVVGGGTAGLTVAARLAEAHFTVGVLEAGQYRPNDPVIDVPKNFGTAVGNANYDWIYATVPQLNVNNRSIRHPRGKVLGGSSAINFEMFNRPAKQEYSAWSALNLGKGQWDWTGILPYLKKSETFTPPRPQDEFPTVSLNRRRSALPALVDEYLKYARDVLGESVVSLVDFVSAGFDDASLVVDARDDPFHGFVGPVKASHNEWYSDVANPFIATMNSLGISTNDEPDSGNNIGIYNCPASVDRSAGVRSYAAPAYFAPNSASANLVVLTGAQATKVNFAAIGTASVAAKSVNFLSGGTQYTVQARKEIILSGGVFNSPQVLELSGVGDKSRLQGFGIESILDLPGVGENLQDHAMVPLSFKLTDGHHTWDELRNNATFAAEAAAQYAATQNGILASTISVLSFFPLQTFLNQTAVESTVSSLISDLTQSITSSSALRILQNVVQLVWLQNRRIPQLEIVMIPGFNPTGTVTVPTAGTSYLTVAAVLQHPFSRGSVHITSTDPVAKPAVDPNYLSVAFDKAVLLEGIKFIRKLASTEPLASHIASFNDPPASSTTDEQLEQYLKLGLESLKHPVGTCAMAPREIGGVVSEQLLVHGTVNLRVVDASVFPLHISAHAQSTTYAIAEKAADTIKLAHA
ncbi:alcohol oxidase [Exidia glandulosa HHB12029]|uniref:Alcohol oxidase n=1 Tax=Exidia glandulosa HHB12029 TaxID=1314781 RepID=A0A165QI20_EXIGL|nr:alcohol oxidase [Exidia glandulosa HHB12029]